jgi:hypothetical protein
MVGMPIVVLPALTTASPGDAGLVEVCRDDVNHDRVTHVGADDAAETLPIRAVMPTAVMSSVPMPVVLMPMGGKFIDGKSKTTDQRRRVMKCQQKNTEEQRIVL